MKKHLLMFAIALSAYAVVENSSAQPIATAEKQVASLAWCEIAGDTQNGGEYTVYQYKFSQDDGMNANGSPKLNSYESKVVLTNVGKSIPSRDYPAGWKIWTVNGDNIKGNYTSDFSVQVESFSSTNQIYLNYYNFSFDQVPTQQIHMRAPNGREWLAFPCDNIRNGLSN